MYIASCRNESTSEYFRVIECFAVKVSRRAASRPKTVCQYHSLSCEGGLKYGCLQEVTRYFASALVLANIAARLGGS